MITQIDDFRAYALGRAYASACTSLTDTEAILRLLDEHPIGPWEIADEDFFSGEKNGHPCPSKPDTHRHILFAC
jgi:hypothetical protein